MFAIIETGSKQYKVTQGTILDIEKLEIEAKEDVIFDKVLLIADENDLVVGKPFIEKATVKATVLEQVKADKIIVFKFKNKTGFKKKQGHRQKLTRIRVNEIIKG